MCNQTTTFDCPAGIYSYELCWEQCGPLDFSPLLQILADNTATVSLDSNPLTTLPTPPPINFTTPATIQGFTPGPGLHTLRVDVSNNPFSGGGGTATGMDLSGTLSGYVRIVPCQVTPPTFTATPTPTPSRTPTSTPTPTARTGCDLAITKIPDLDPPTPGFPFVFEVTVTNVGNVPCQPTTTVTDSLLPGFTVTGFNFNTADGWGCTAPPGISCTNFTLTLQPGHSSVVFDVTVTATPGIAIQNCATVTNQHDVNSANNTACYTVGITSPTPTPTSTPTVTRTPTPTRTPKYPPDCVGDCNTDGAVTVDDILTMVNIALGNADVSRCISGDASGDGMFTIDEILTAVNNVLNGCPAQVTVELHAVPVRVCGKSFQRLEVAAPPGVVVHYANRPLGETHFTFALPEAFQASSDSGTDTIQVQFRISAAAAPDSAQMILPDIPAISDGEPSRAGQPGYCDLVDMAVQLYPTLRGTARSSLVELTLGDGTNSVRALFPLVQSMARVQSEPALTNSASYLIITQDLYRPEADQLAAYRNSRGVATQVISVSELPGYNANAPTPPECTTSPYDRECYHYWGDAIANVSPLAVPSLVGFHRETHFADQYSRVSYIPGLIRAYIRRLKADGKLKAVLLIGDPEAVPPIFTPKTDFSAGRSTGCSSFNGVSEQQDDYCQGDYRFTLGTDLYYAIPSIPLPLMRNQLAQSAVNMAQLTPFMVTCDDHLGHLEMKEWCESNESPYWGPPGRGMRYYGWVPHYPFTRTFDDPVSAGVPLTALTAADVLAVGRIVTQTRFFLPDKDPAVQNYVDKLKAWELVQHRGLSQRSIATFGGEQGWLWAPGDVQGFFSMTGIVPDTSSMIYGSTVYFPALANACAAAGHPSQCTVNDPLTIMETEMPAVNRTSWLLDGHGGHSGIQGPYISPIPSPALGFRVFNSYGLINDRLHEFVDPEIAPTVSLAKSGHFIGHVIANSCDPASYFDYNSFNWLIYTGAGPPFDTGTQGYMDSLVAPASFAESLIGLHNGGAINTYLNYFVGFGGSDNSYNQLFMEHADYSRAHGLPIGNAYINMVVDVMTKPQLQGYNHQVLNRVFMGDPLAVIGPQ
ncbi:MAG TPA: C25 family cysteine peptidase [Candidatus Binatia bacterium]